MLVARLETILAGTCGLSRTRLVLLDKMNTNTCTSSTSQKSLHSLVNSRAPTIPVAFFPTVTIEYGKERVFTSCCRRFIKKLSVKEHKVGGAA
jgi:hypothetical protein